MITGTPATPTLAQALNFTLRIGWNTTGLTTDYDPITYELQWSNDAFSSVLGSTSLDADSAGEYEITGLPSGMPLSVRVYATDAEPSYVASSELYEYTTDDFTGPVFSAAATTSDGLAIEITADETVYMPFSPGPEPYSLGFSGFTIQSISAGNPVLLNFTEANRILLGDSPGAVAYTSDSQLQDANGNNAQSNGSIGAGSTTNVSQAVRPTFVSAAVNEGQEGYLVVTYSGALAAQSDFSASGIELSGTYGILTAVDVTIVEGESTALIQLDRIITKDETVTYANTAYIDAIQQQTYGTRIGEVGTQSVTNGSPKVRATAGEIGADGVTVSVTLSGAPGNASGAAPFNIRVGLGDDYRDPISWSITGSMLTVVLDEVDVILAQDEDVVLYLDVAEPVANVINQPASINLTNNSELTTSGATFSGIVPGSYRIGV